MSVNPFDVPDIDYRYEAKRWVPFKPANTGRRPILFIVPASDDYYDLNETKVEIKIRLNTASTVGISSAEGAASDANNTNYVYSANNFGRSLFKQMNVNFSGVQMTEQSNSYHQKAYIETLVNYNGEQGKTILAAQGRVNELNVAEELTPTNAANNDEPDDAPWAGKTGLEALTSRLLGKVCHTSMVKLHVSAEQGNVWSQAFKLT